MRMMMRVAMRPRGHVVHGSFRQNPGIEAAASTTTGWTLAFDMPHVRSVISPNRGDV